MTERKITDAILLEAPKHEARLFRQNTGQAWVGKVVRQLGGDVLLKNPRVLHVGLTKGSSDLIGITPVTITPDMVGKTVGVFTAMEVKHGKTATTEEQTRFLAMVRKAGGIGAIVRSVDDFTTAIGAWLLEKEKEPPRDR